VIGINNADAFTVSLIKNIFSQGARAAKICLLGGLVLLGLLWCSFSQKKNLRLFSRIILTIATLGGIITIALAIQPGNPIYQLMVNHFGEGTVRGRLVVWETGWQGFLDRPWLGWGPENFNLVFARHYNPCIGSPECSGENWFDRAHNMIIDTLAETGIAGLLSYIALFTAALWLLWRPVFKKNQLCLLPRCLPLFCGLFYPKSHSF